MPLAETGKACHAMMLKSGDLPASGTENLFGRRFSDYEDLVVPHNKHDSMRERYL